jgi:prepilin peptidase CpaA
MDDSLLISSVICVIVAAVIDIRTQKIPNWLTLPSILIGIILNFSVAGNKGLISSALGLLTGFLLLYFVYLLGGMGAGDVKLLCAVGALLGPRMVFYTFIWMALAGGALALLFILYKRAFSQTFRNIKILLLGWVLGTAHSEANITIKNRSLIKLPYAVAIALGTLLAVWLKQIPNFGF